MKALVSKPPINPGSGEPKESAMPFELSYHPIGPDFVDVEMTLPQFLIYHNKNFLRYSADRMLNNGIHPTIKPEDLTLVGKVNACDLDQVFYITNSIDRPWWRHHEVIWWRPSRSTSVGDVILDIDSNIYYIVESIGFTHTSQFFMREYLLESDMPKEAHNVQPRFSEKLLAYLLHHSRRFNLSAIRNYLRRR